jgi:hypothetical protein
MERNRGNVSDAPTIDGRMVRSSTVCFWEARKRARPLRARAAAREATRRCFGTLREP